MATPARYGISAARRRGAVAAAAIVVLAGSDIAPGPASATTPTTSHTVVDTRAGIGAPKGVLKDSRHIDVAFFGAGGLPGGGVARARLAVTVLDVRNSGSLSVRPESGAVPARTVIHFRDGTTTRRTLDLAMPVNGRLVFTNLSPSRFDLVVRVVGDTPLATRDAWLQQPGNGAFANPADALSPASVRTLRANTSLAGVRDTVRTNLLSYDDTVVYGAAIGLRNGVVSRSLATGGLLWFVPSGTANRIAARNGVLYVSGTYPQQSVTAIDLRTRAVLWHVLVPNPSKYRTAFAVQLFADGGQVYVVDEAYRMFAFDALTGRRLWVLHSVTRAAATDGTVVMHRGGGTEYRNGRTGLLYSAFEAGDALDPAVVQDGYAVFAQQGRVYAYRLAACRPTSCRPAWMWRGELVPGGIHEGGLTVAAGAVGGRVIVSFDPRGSYVDKLAQLFVLDLHTGRVVWLAHFPAGALAGQPVSTGRSVLTFSRGTLTAVPLACAAHCTARSTGAVTFTGDIAPTLVVAGRNVLATVVSYEGVPGPTLAVRTP